jgi:putative salt-induced outer membrane protein YdiY
MTVELLNGDVVTGEIVERTDEHIVLKHPVLGRLDIPMNEVNPRSLHVGIAGSSFLEGWDKEVDIGFSGSQGDSDEADLVVGASLDFLNDRKRVTLSAHYALSYADKEIDDNNARASLLRDWLFPGSRWLGFSYTTYDFDDFEAWEHRVSTGGGPGYRIIPGEPLQLTFRTGPFIGYEFGDEDDARPEYAVGLFNTYKDKRGRKLNLFNTYYQTVDHPEFRNVTTFELRLPWCHGASA